MPLLSGVPSRPQGTGVATRATRMLPLPCYPTPVPFVVRCAQ